MRICIYGGTTLDHENVAFISTLTDTILSRIPAAVIVTGGFKVGHDAPKAKSTDVAALAGARQFARRTGRELKSCFEAWIPDPTLDDRDDVGGVTRMSNADGCTIRVIGGRTPLGRRLAMATSVDVVITISGHRHTEVVVEQALEMGLPVLPIPDAGGDSKDLLKKHKKRIAANFANGGLERSLKKISAHIVKSPVRAAAAVVDLIKTAKVGKCLVLLPYDETHNRLYAREIRPTVAARMLPVRLDNLPSSRAIYTSFADAIQQASAVVADVTTINGNVMYEIGYAHGRGLTPLLYTRNRARVNNLPVYFRTLNVKVVSARTPLTKLIGDYLQEVKDARRQGLVPERK